MGAVLFFAKIFRIIILLRGKTMKLGVVGIIIERDRSVAEKVQTILSENADLIMGRMGIPDKDRGVYVISVIVRGTNERISALTGKLGKLENVKVKSAVTDSDD